MVVQRILRVPISSGAHEVQQTDHAIISVNWDGGQPLDLILEGTEGTTPYVGRICHSEIPNLVVKNSSIDLVQWEKALRYTFLREPASPSTDGLNVNVEVIATLQEDGMSLLVRKKVSGIYQRLGEVHLAKDEEHEVDIFAWLSTAVARGDEMEARTSLCQMEKRQQVEEIAELKGRLEQLVEAKTQHEEALLHKFRELLNAKKVKIRQQQRSLASVSSRLSE